MGYPVLVRPSYVLGGRAMVIAYDDAAVVRYMTTAIEYSQERPVLIDHFLEDAQEVRCGCAVRWQGCGDRRHHAAHRRGGRALGRFVVRAAGGGSDARRCWRRFATYTRKLALALNVIGLVNLQFAIQRGKVFVIEVNPRASRTVPYVSKATGVQLAKIASRLMTGRTLKELLPEQVASGKDLGTGEHFFVKSPVFPWGKFQGVDPVLGPEMKSTGEVMGVADNFGEAFAKAQIAAGQICRLQGTVFLSVNDHDKEALVALARRFVDMGFQLVATHGTAEVLEEAGLQVERVYKVKEGRPNVVDLIKGDRIQLIVNTPRGQERVFDEQAIRRAAVLARVPTITTLAAARAAAEGIEALQNGTLSVVALQTLHAARREAAASRVRATWVCRATRWIRSRGPTLRRWRSRSVESGIQAADEQAVAAHEAAAVLEVEEGAPEFVECAAVLAEAVAGGKVEHPDADDREDEQAGDPDVAGDVVALRAGDEEADDHGDEEGQGRAEQLGSGGVLVGMAEGDGGDDCDEGKDGDQGVRAKPDGFGTEFADGFALRNFEIFGHSCRVKCTSGGARRNDTKVEVCANEPEWVR